MTQLTFSTGHNYRPGTKLRIGARNYVVTSVESHTSIFVRRTFWQFVLDVIESILSVFD